MADVRSAVDGRPGIQPSGVTARSLRMSGAHRSEQRDSANAQVFAASALPNGQNVRSELETSENTNTSVPATRPT